jgi:hypothetical protein
MTNFILFLLLIAGVALIVYGLYEYVDAGSIYNTFAVKNNIIGYGKAEGLYLIATENYYLVAGRKVKNKRKAIKEFFELINRNKLLPPDMYFKVIRAKGVTLKEEPEEGRDFAESLIKYRQKQKEKEERAMEELEKALEIKKEPEQFITQVEQKKSFKVKRRL